MTFRDRKLVTCGLARWLFETEQSCESSVKDNRGNSLICKFEKQKLRKQRIVPIVSIVFKTSLLF